MAGEQPDWAPCGQDGCIGVRLPATALCLAHAAEQIPEGLDAELKRVGTEGTVDARGVVISAELLGQLLTAAPRTDDRPAFNAVRFEQATFQGEAVFEGASFQGDARFEQASFQGEAWFDWVSFQGEAGFGQASFQGLAMFNGATFQGEAEFNSATFQGKAGFSGATFQEMPVFAGATFQRDVAFDASFERGAEFAWAAFKDDVLFMGATFQGKTGFAEASFQGTTWFDEASFQDEVWFDHASFQGEVQFEHATFQDKARFARATFQSMAKFAGASFQGEARFDGVTFERATQLGPLLARQLILDGAAFTAPVQLEVTAAVVCARRAQFPAGVHLRLRFASVSLDDANLAAPAVLAGVPSPFRVLEEQEEQAARIWERLPPGPRSQRGRPRLVSICRADVAGLRLADVDLRACQFVGAHNLDRLRIESAPLFARTTGWWRARRKTLAEEQHWRAHRPGRWQSAGWYPRACQPPQSPKAEAPRVLEPARLAALYRELRKGREDAKDEPGAADFYYGECEMRRHDPGTPKAERLVLWAYWLVSGYALRASRAVLAWALLVVVGAAILAGIGFKPLVSPQIVPVDVSNGQAIYEKREVSRPSSLEQLREALAFSAESTVSLLRAPDRALTLPGRWVQMILRILGPVLFGLVVLSLRGRVRR